MALLIDWHCSLALFATSIAFSILLASLVPFCSCPSFSLGLFLFCPASGLTSPDVDFLGLRDRRLCAFSGMPVRCVGREGVLCCPASEVVFLGQPGPTKVRLLNASMLCMFASFFRLLDDVLLGLRDHRVCACTGIPVRRVGRQGGGRPDCNACALSVRGVAAPWAKLCLLGVSCNLVDMTLVRCSGMLGETIPAHGGYNA